MKKKLFFLFALNLGIAVVSNAQLTASCGGGCPLIEGGVFVFQSSPTPHYGYSLLDSGGYGYLYILQKTTYLGNTVWAIERIHLTSGGGYSTAQMYRSSPSPTSTLPPCSDSWEKASGFGTGFITINFTGTATIPCEVLGISSSSTSTPTGTELARLTSGMISAMTSPRVGKIVYDISINKVKYFNGTTWVEL